MIPGLTDHWLWGRAFCATERALGKVVTVFHRSEYMCPGRYENICTWYRLWDLGDITYIFWSSAVRISEYI